MKPLEALSYHLGNADAHIRLLPVEVSHMELGESVAYHGVRVRPVDLLVDLKVVDSPYTFVAQNAEQGAHRPVFLEARYEDTA